MSSERILRNLRNLPNIYLDLEVPCLQLVSTLQTSDRCIRNNVRSYAFSWFSSWESEKFEYHLEYSFKIFMNVIRKMISTILLE